MDPAPENAAIEVRGLEAGYGETTILTDVSFAVQPGEIFFVIGGSGCGKSTLLKHMIGLNEPTAGEVHYFGRSFTAADEPGRRRLQRLFGVLYQSSALWSSMTLAQNVGLPLELYTPLPSRQRQALVSLKLSQVGLGGYEGFYPAALSGGMKKRAALARALALDPKILFFDEPSAGLDPVTSRNLDDLILRTRDSLGATMVIVSHELHSIFAIADRIIMLHPKAKGIIAQGRPRELLETSKDPRVLEFLGGGRS
jgi:phospholipid/cholesterol/gamma-HCH transport system ATP-binding protein